jgi:hypothetical protein
MDLETVIGCFREARLGRRMTAGLEGYEQLVGDAGRARRQVTMRDGISA